MSLLPPNTLDFLAGGIHFRVSGSGEIKLGIDSPYRPFLNVCRKEPDALVTVLKGIPPELEGSVEVFQGLNEDGAVKAMQQPDYQDIPQVSWCIRQNGNIKIIVTGNNEHFLVFGPELKNFKLYVNTNPQISKFPNFQIRLFPYPIGPLLLYYLALANHAFMIHASGVFDNGKGRLFTGFSGSGKSTMARLWQSGGARIINDDRILIRKKDGRFCMYNTPMAYPDAPKVVTVDAIYLLHHDLQNAIHPVTGVQAAASVLSFCIQHHYERWQVERLLGMVSELTASIPVYHLPSSAAMNPQPDIAFLSGLGADLLLEGRTVRVTVGGRSMWPWIRKGDVAIIEPFSPGEEPLRGQLVVFPGAGKLIAHRLIAVRMTSAGKRFFTKGDACTRSDSPLEREQILGHLVSLERNGRKKIPGKGRFLASLSRVTGPAYYCFYLSHRVYKKVLRSLY
ncbi:MAG: hypothetical protein NTU44_01310 [Bacteroidetes bacterium]|nr:hypothetical protein [Bacteroidota bacterium]